MKFNSVYSLLFENKIQKDVEEESAAIIDTLVKILDNPKFDYYVSSVRDFTDCKVIKVGEHKDIGIYLINGNNVKTTLWPDFVEGGNDKVYSKNNGEIAKFMPDNQVWVDATLTGSAIEYVLFHELIERYMMDKYNYEYEDAHELADSIEMKLRKQKLFEKVAKNIDFPFSRQVDGNSCGHTAVQLMLKYYGIDSTIEDIKAIFTDKENSYGLTPEMIVKVFEKYDLKASIVENLSTEVIKRQYIDNESPIIVEFQAWGKDLKNKNKNGHYAVVIGYTPTYFFLSDPSLNGKGYIKIDEFEKRWHDINNKKLDKKLAIIIHNKKADFDFHQVEKIE